MMVDPKFMIVYNLRLFLTDVIPAAVAPTAVILRYNFVYIGPIWNFLCTILNLLGPF